MILLGLNLEIHILEPKVSEYFAMLMEVYFI